MNREDWLAAVARRMAPWFADLGHPLPPIRMAIGFPSNGKRSKAIGECWSNDASADGVHEIFITPFLNDAMRVADVLAHELVHAVVGIDAKHGPRFGRVARAIGLEGKLTATVAGEAFKRNAGPMLEAVGPLPHGRLSVASESSSTPKQSTRLRKCECPTCGYVARVARKWLEAAGAPCCPADQVRMVVADTPKCPGLP